MISKALLSIKLLPVNNKINKDIIKTPLNTDSILSLKS